MADQIQRLMNRLKDNEQSLITYRMHEPKTRIEKLEKEKNIFLTTSKIFKLKNKYEELTGRDLYQELYLTAEFRNKYEIKDQINFGGFGKVYTGIEKGTNKVVAIKVIRKYMISKWIKEGEKLIPKEIAMLKKVQGIEGIIELYDYYDMGYNISIVMQNPQDMKDLFEILNEKDKIEEAMVKKIIRQILNITIECKEKGVLHRDIKPENILINAKGDIFLIDFGEATEYHLGDYAEIKGTRAYTPPEYLEFEIYLAEPGTIWCIGVMAYYLINGRLPFNNKDEIKRAELKFTMAFSEESKEFIKACLEMIPAARLTFEDAIKHPFLY